MDEGIDSVINCLDAPFASKKRIWHSRPSNWAIIAEEANIYGNYSTIRTYQEVFSHASSLASIKLLEMHVESALNMGEEEIFIPAEAEKSDRDEELVLADLSASDSGSDSDSD